LRHAHAHKGAGKLVRTLCRQGFVLAVWKSRYVTNARRRRVPTSVGAVLCFFLPPYFAAYRILSAAPRMAKEVGGGIWVARECAPLRAQRVLMVLRSVLRL
jgi:hypothetical protein